ncbi:MAG TPA: L,D-transpeptidase [Xanthobacteraceae bacterium]|jgi:lipoprotein-anchoring transpeptidase ErfK/SrfK|nr:L,D-transpeptidase [Xanthobacteraceae bacterium]
MRRICLTAFVVSAVPASAFNAAVNPAMADPLQVIYSPYAMSQPAQPPAYQVYQQQTYMMEPVQAAPQQVAPQQYYVYQAQPQPQPQNYAPPPRGVAAQTQGYGAAPAYTGTVAQRRAAAPRPAPQSAPMTYAAAAPQPAPEPAPASRGFLESIFGGPTIERRVYPSQYDQTPQAQPTMTQPTAYAPSSQGDMAAANYQIDPKFMRQIVAYQSNEPAGTVVIDTPNKFLYLVEGGGRAMRYGIGVGRPGFTWAGVKTVSAKKEWPDWRPPDEMLQRRPDLPRYMPGGMDNPLGARAMYLGSTLYRIHGSNEPWTIGTNVSSGCIRMRNEDVEDLYDRVKVGTKVVVI